MAKAKEKARVKEQAKEIKKENSFS